ncbi:MAG: ABC transporter permease [Alphaproteobacteria bacterium]|nr:ABC transporter permease [Alphaproteobacteria bacterium]
MGLHYTKNKQQLIITLDGVIKRYDDQRQIKTLLDIAQQINEIKFSTTSHLFWDSSLAAVLYKILTIAQKNNSIIQWDGLPKNLAQFLKLSIEIDRKPERTSQKKFNFLENLGNKGLLIYSTLKNTIFFIKQIIFSLGRYFSGKAVMRKIDLEFALEDSGYKAVGIISLVSFMVGLILAFVGAIQLKTFGAQIYIASLVTIGMIRIMGAIMTGIIMAGRTGASYAATIGTMQVNEEIDALKTFGFEVSDFLILPRFLSLVVSMPFLTILSDIMGIIGGAFVGIIMLDISIAQYWQYSIDAFGLTNFLVGLFHSFIYGIIIACCGCYYGINCGRNADSVGLATTKAVVSSIVIMIVATGFLTLIFQVIGL